MFHLPDSCDFDTFKTHFPAGTWGGLMLMAVDEPADMVDARALFHL